MGFIFTAIIGVIVLGLSWLAGLAILQKIGVIKEGSDVAKESIVVHILAIVVGFIPACFLLSIFMFDFESFGILKP